MFRRFLKPSLNVLTLGSTVIKTHPFQELHLTKIYLNSSASANNLPPQTDQTDVTKTTTKKKTPFIPKITLLSGNEMNVTTIEEAQKLAKRRDLKLVKIIDIDTKTNRPVYRLMTGKEYHEEDLKQRERKKAEKQKSFFKGEKVLMMSHNIFEHDLQTHCNKVLKWLAKHYEVKVVINGDPENMKKAENVYSLLEEKLGNHCRILQKRTKGSDIKFQVVPPKESKNNSNNEHKTESVDPI